MNIKKHSPLHIKQCLKFITLRYTTLIFPEGHPRSKLSKNIYLRYLQPCYPKEITIKYEENNI